MSKTADEIKARFLEELKNIREFVSHTDELMQPDIKLILQIDSLLHSKGIEDFYWRKRHYRYHPIDKNELPTLTAAMDRVEPQINRVLEETRAKAATIEPQLPPAAEHIPMALLDRMNEWIEHFTTHLTAEPTDEERQHLIDQATLADALVEREQRNEEDEDKPELSDEEYDKVRREFFRAMVARAEYERFADQIYGLQSALWAFGKMRTAIRSKTPDAEVNLLRQGFLLLMTTFDAAVFDIFRVAMQTNFFELLAMMASDRNVKPRDWRDFSSMDQFRDKLIEQHLKGRYLKDILATLRENRVNSNAANDDCRRLTEIINRRNIHIHNRGRVDDRYLEVPDLNLDGLLKDQLAEVSDAYLKEAERITTECVDKLTAWVNAGAAI